MSTPWRHGVLAYLLLFGIIAGLLNSVVMPWYTVWQATLQHNAQLRQTIEAHRQAHIEASKRQASLQQALKNLFEEGELLALDANRAAYEWQASIKSLLRDAGVNLTAFTPSQEQLEPNAAVLRLELSFLTEVRALQTVLAGLTNVPGKARVELLSLRTASAPNMRAATASHWLEGRMLLSTLSADLSASASLDYTSWHLPSPVTAFGPNRLTALFDTATRTKFLSPQVTHYRVAAITVTEQNRMAVVIDNSSGESYRVKVGDFIDAWAVRAIEPDHIRIQAGALETRMTLQE